VREALFDDINISEALAALFRLVRQANYLMTQGRLHQDDAADVETALRTVDEVLGILPPQEKPEELPTEIQDLLRQRDEARKQKDFALADEIRDGLVAQGYVIEDIPGGTRIKRKN